jgi:hypothetical protein
MKRTAEYLTLRQAIDRLLQGGRLIRRIQATAEEWLILPSGDRLKSRDAIKIIERTRYPIAGRWASTRMRPNLDVGGST